MNEEQSKIESQDGFKDLEKAIYSFAESLAALRDFVTLTGSLLDERQERLMHKHKRDFFVLSMAFISAFKGTPFPQEDIPVRLKKEIGDVNITLTGAGRAELDAEYDFDLKSTEALKGLFEQGTHKSLLYRSALISLVSSAEWFLSQVIRQHFRLRPNALGTKDKTLSLEDLKTFGTVDDAVQHLIRQRIDEIMWGSLDDWLKFLHEQLKLSTGYLDPHKDKLVEIFQRRNVMVHNNGQVHPSYVAKVKQELRKNLSLGQEITVTPEYLRGAIDLVEQMFILFAAEFWKQSSPSDNNRGNTLINVAFDQLKRQNWTVAEYLSLFLVRDKKLQERDQMIGLLNYWQSLKWQGRFSEVAEEVKAADFSAKDELYELTRYALLDDATKFTELLPQVMKAGKLKSEDVTNWPIFKEMRKTKEFAKLCKTRGKELDLASPDTIKKSGRTEHKKVSRVKISVTVPRFSDPKTSVPVQTLGGETRTPPSRRLSKPSEAKGEKA